MDAGVSSRVIHQISPNTSGTDAPLSIDGRQFTKSRAGCQQKRTTNPRLYNFEFLSVILLFNF